MKLGVVVHRQSEPAVEVASELVERAKANGLATIADSWIAGNIGAEEGDLLSDPLDMVVAVGGDGTVLEAVQFALARDVPIFGVNLGRIGFLADVEPTGLQDAVQVVTEGNWIESRRMTLEARVEDRQPQLGINDVVVEKVISQRLVSIEVLVDGESFLVYHADGLVLSTPTGSSAYNLSAGGPLVDPAIEAIVLTPVAHHSLFSVPMVYPPSTILQCRVSHDRPVSVNVDGHDLGRAAPGESIYIRRGVRPARFVQHSGRSYSRLISDKLRLQ